MYKMQQLISVMQSEVYQLRFYLIFDAHEFTETLEPL